MLAGLVASGCEQAAVRATGAPRSSQIVEVITLSAQPLTVTTRLNGVVAAFETADIRPQVSGLIREQLFAGGELVAKGQPLYQIDPRPFQNKLDYAQAEYDEARAKLDLARSKLNRYVNLSHSNSVSQQGLEDVKLSYAEAEAQAKLKLANLHDAQLNLEYTQVLAPIAGIAGKSAVTKGALVTANQTTRLTSVADISKVWVDLQQSAIDFRHWQRALREGRLEPVKGGPPVLLMLGGRASSRHQGRLMFNEVEVNESSGNLTLRTLFDNPDHVLLPGMNVAAELHLGSMKAALILPEEAVLHDARGGSYCFTVANGRSQRRALSVQNLDDGRYLILEGLSGGEQVVTVGKSQLRDDMAVEVTAQTAAPESGTASKDGSAAQKDGSAAEKGSSTVEKDGSAAQKNGSTSTVEKHGSAAVKTGSGDAERA